MQRGRVKRKKAIRKLTEGRKGMFGSAEQKKSKEWVKIKNLKEVPFSRPTLGHGKAERKKEKQHG